MRRIGIASLTMLLMVALSASAAFAGNAHFIKSATSAARSGANLVLSGHKHVPYAWKLEDLFIVNAGTVSSLRLRGNTRPCYNVIEFSGTHVDVWRKYPFHGQEKIIQFAVDTLEFEKYTARIEGEVTSRR